MSTSITCITLPNEQYGGKLDFAMWANRNMIVIAQIESKTAYDNLDGILSAPGLTGITGGPHDLAASLGHPREPNHPECQRLTAEAARRARAAGQTVSSDMVVSLGLPELLLGAARAFAAEHRHDAYVPPQAATPTRKKAPGPRGTARRPRRSGVIACRAVGSRDTTARASRSRRR